MKPLTAREMAALLQARGWFEVSQKGSHRKFAHPFDPRLRAILPVHPGEDLTPGVQHSIMRAAGITRDEIENRGRK